MDALGAQQNFAADQIDQLAPKGVLRIDAQPEYPIAMDDARKVTATTLIDLGNAAFEQAAASHGARLRALPTALDGG